MFRISRCCCCLCCTSLIFLLIFFTAVSICTHQERVHHIVEDVTISNLNISDSIIHTATLTLKLHSRNANKKLGVRFIRLQISISYSSYRPLKLGDSHGPPLELINFPTNVYLYHGTQLGKIYVPSFFQAPRNITHLEAALKISGMKLPSPAAARLQKDAALGYIPLRIHVKAKAAYQRVDRSWQTKGKGVLGAEDSCQLMVSLYDSLGATHLRGRSCGWTVGYRNPGP